MIRHFSILTAVACAFLASTAVGAQTGRAPCGSFQKLPDGKWRALKPVKIENGSVSAMIGIGTIIGPGARVTGLDVYAALEKSCH